jgi:hypothetical protein
VDRFLGTTAKSVNRLKRVATGAAATGSRGGPMASAATRSIVIDEVARLAYVEVIAVE